MSDTTGRASLDRPTALVPPWLRWLGAIGWRIFVVIVVIGVIGALATILASVTAGILVALIVAATFAPADQALRRRGWSPTNAAAVITIGAVLIIGGTILLIVLAFAPYVTQALQSIQQGVAAIKDAIASANLSPEIATAVSNAQAAIAQWLESQVGDIVSTVASVSTVGVLALFLTFFALRDGDKGWHWGVDRASDWRQTSLTAAGREALRRVGGYLRGMAIVAAVRAVSDFVFLTLLGVPLAAPLSVLVFLAGFIPYVGGLIATGAIILVMLGTTGGASVVVFLVLITIVNLLMRSLLAPLIFGRTVSLHPAIVLLALPAGAAVAGIIGLFAVIPVIAFVMAVAPAVVRVLGEPSPHGAEVVGGVPVWLDRLAQWSWRLLVAIGLLGVGIAAATAIPVVVIPLVLGLTLASTFSPAVDRLRRRGLSQGRAALAVTAGAALGIIALVLVSLSALAAPLVAAIQTSVDGAGSLSGGSPGSVPTGTLPSWLPTLVSHAGSGIVTFASDVIRGIGAGILIGLIGILLTFYFLKDGPGLWSAATQRFRGRRRTEIDAAGHGAFTVLGGYIFGTGALGLFNAVTGFLIMTILGLPYALPVAVISFFGQFIPYIGQFVTSLIGFLIAFAVGTPQDILIMGIYTIIMNIVQGSFLQPIVYSRAVNLHPALVFIAIPAGSELAGIVGMFLAVPVVGIISTCWRHVVAAMDSAATGAETDDSTAQPVSGVPEAAVPPEAIGTPDPASPASPAPQPG